MMCLIFHKFFCDTVQFILEAEMNFNLCFAMNIYVVDLKLEKERLLALKAAQYDTYTYYKDYQKELRTACANVDNILGQHHIRDHTQRTEQTL